MGLLSNIQKSMGRQKKSVAKIDREAVLRALSVVQDPDLGKDIVSLGFVKDVEITGTQVQATVELTTPACPVKEQLRAQCIEAISGIPGVEQIQVKMTAQSAPQPQADTPKAPTTGLSGVKNIIAVASGKGGVGKSTVAVNLAFNLAENGATVGIIDADVYGPSLARMTNVTRPEVMDGNLVIPPQVDGIKMMSSAMFLGEDKAAALRGPMAAQLIQQFLHQTKWGKLDYLIIDYPPGTGDIQLTLSQQATITGAVIVTTPQDLSLIDAKKAAQMFELTQVQAIGVVETMSYFVCDDCSKKHHIFRSGGGKKLADSLGIPLLAEIPIDTQVGEAGDSGIPFVKHKTASGASAVFSQMGESIVRQLSIMNHQSSDVLQSFQFNWN